MKSKSMLKSKSTSNILKSAVTAVCAAALCVGTAFGQTVSGKAGTFTDSRDGKVYKTSEVGADTWMSQNLNFQAPGNSWCYGNDNAKCETYGRLYDWNTAVTACPAGWHLSTSTDWVRLLTAAGGVATAGAKLKASIWQTDGADALKFTALPGGHRNVNGTYNNGGRCGGWWTTKINSDTSAHNQFICGANVDKSDNHKNIGGSVRCVKDGKDMAEANAAVKEAAAKTAANGYKAQGGDAKQQAGGGSGAGTFTDSRDGKKYKTVKIGGQTWMAENLNFQAGKSWCYDNKNSNCDKYGRLYDWNTATKVCPKGWHLSNNDEWNALIDAVGGSSTAGKKLKSTISWKDNANGTDAYGFSALPGGNRGGDGNFYNVDVGSWWTASPYPYSCDDCAFNWVIDKDEFMNESYADKGDGFFVRCIRD